MNNTAADTENRLIDALDNFASTNNLSIEDLRKLLWQLLGGTKLYSRKGSTGIIAKDLFVDLRKGRREIANGEQKVIWTDPDDSMNESVLIRDGHVIPSTNGKWSAGQSPQQIVVFTADKVHIFDFERGTGGFYDRE
jgi:hypothetical protein